MDSQRPTPICKSTRLTELVDVDTKIDIPLVLVFNEQYTSGSRIKHSIQNVLQNTNQNQEREREGLG